MENQLYKSIDNKFVKKEEVIELLCQINILMAKLDKMEEKNDQKISSYPTKKVRQRSSSIQLKNTHQVREELSDEAKAKWWIELKNRIFTSNFSGFPEWDNLNDWYKKLSTSWKRRLRKYAILFRESDSFSKQIINFILNEFSEEPVQRVSDLVTSYEVLFEIDDIEDHKKIKNSIKYRLKFFASLNGLLSLKRIHHGGEFNKKTYQAGFYIAPWATEKQVQNSMDQYLGLPSGFVPVVKEKQVPVSKSIRHFCTNCQIKITDQQVINCTNNRHHVKQLKEYEWEV